VTSNEEEKPDNDWQALCLAPAAHQPPMN